MKKFSSSLAVTVLAFASLAAINIPVAHATGYTFTRNITVGDTLTSAEASALTSDLTSEGLWNSATPISTYNSAVASAITQFQEKYASDILAPNGLTQGNGFFGFFTRAKINSLYGGTQSAQCPARYTCIPIVQTTTAACPAGYTCTLKSSANTTNTSTNTLSTSLNDIQASTTFRVSPKYTLVSPTHTLSTSDSLNNTLTHISTYVTTNTTDSNTNTNTIATNTNPSPQNANANTVASSDRKSVV